MRIKKIIGAFAEHSIAAHKAGCTFVSKHACVPAAHADIAISSVRPERLSGRQRYDCRGKLCKPRRSNHHDRVVLQWPRRKRLLDWLKHSRSVEEVKNKIRSIPPEETLPDQWKAQILARILTKCKAAIIVSSHVDPQLIKDMYMLHAETFERALAMADEMLGSKPRIVIIPGGVGVIIEEQT